MTWLWIVLGIGCWLLMALVLALVLCGAIRLADRRG